MKKMKKEETKQFIRWCILGAVGCGFMAAGDWLLGWERSGAFSIAISTDCFLLRCRNDGVKN